MKKSYKIKIHQGGKSTDIDLQTSEFTAEPTTLLAQAGARYQFIGTATGWAPDNLRARRSGKNLLISLEDREQADVVIADFYEHTDPGFSALIGETEAGVFYAYVPESAQTAAQVSDLADGSTPVGMALGGEPVQPAGAAVGALVGMAFNPLWAAPLALAGAAAAGSGGAGGAVTPVPAPKPKVLSAKLATADDSGFSATDGITADNTPRLEGQTDAGAIVIATINGHTYTQIANAQGQYTIEVIDPLPDGVQTYEVVAQDAAGSSDLFVGTPFTVDTSAPQNYSPTVQGDANNALKIDISAITNDTGVKPDDFITHDNTLIFKGVLDRFSANGDKVELVLRDAHDAVVGRQYIDPVQTTGKWGWSWDLTGQTLPDGTYRLSSDVTDLAGNKLTAGAEKIILVDTNMISDTDATMGITVTALLQDSGVSGKDFLTNARALSFKGSIADLPTGFTGKVLVQVLGTDGKVLSMDYLDPAADGAWSYDNTARKLGVSGASTQYLLKASLVDLAGNILKSTDQSFMVDLKAPVFTIGGDIITDSSSYVRYNTMELRTGSLGDQSDAEKGVFAFTDGNGAPLNLPTRSVGPSEAYDPGQFVITYTDLAGNSFQLKNDKRWEFKLEADILVDASGSQTQPSTFGQGELAGSVGQWLLKSEETVVDLSSVYSPSPQAGDVAALNHVGLSGGGASAIANVDHTLKLSMGDVLALGVKNSFVSSGAFKDHQQMRIDGDAGDKVLLDDLVGGSAAHTWTPSADLLDLGGAKYRVYSNADLALDLFVQQAIPTTLL